MASRHGQNTAKAFALGAREPGRAHDRASHTPKSTSGTRRYSEHRRCLSKPLCAPLRGSWSPNAARATSGRLCAAAVVRSACPCVRLSRAARTHTHLQPATRELGERTKSGRVAHHVPWSSSRRSTCQTSEQRARSALSAPLASDCMQRAQRFECGRRISSASYRSEDAGGHLHDQDYPMSLPGQSDNMLPPT